MGEEKPKEYYNQALKLASRPLEDSPWLRLYLGVSALVPRAGHTRGILDLGCGTGRFSRLLQDQGHTKYLGVDFADKAVELAKQYAPQLDFVVANLLEHNLEFDDFEYDTVVMLEVVEHIESDKAVIEKLKPGSTIVISAPNYDSVGHVRTFDSFDAVAQRYADQIVFEDENRLTIRLERRPDRCIFVLKGTILPKARDLFIESQEKDRQLKLANCKVDSLGLDLAHIADELQKRTAALERCQLVASRRLEALQGHRARNRQLRSVVKQLRSNAKAQRQ